MALTNTTKYLINFDRNSRQTNAVLFGVPEADLMFQKQGDQMERKINKESDKVTEILKIVGNRLLLLLIQKKSPAALLMT